MLPRPSPKPVILVVDDTPENIDILKGALIPDYTVRPATSGQTALRVAAILPYPDLILLDIMMPEMDGYEVCRRLKSNPVTREIPVIFVTAKSTEGDELMGLNLGAVDYIVKPFSIPIVQSRVKTQLSLRNATQALAEKNRVLLAERTLIESILLKMRQADRIHDQHLRFLLSPVETTAGDLLLSTVTPDGRELVLLGDFTGHGLSAAIGGPLVAYILHDLAIRNMSALEILATINAQLCARLPTGHFFAAALFEISQDRQHGLVWNAGLPTALLVRQGTVHARLPSTLPPLGILAALDFAGEAFQLIFVAGDRLYAFSDGVVEASSPTQGMFGEDRLEAFLLADLPNRDSLDPLIALLSAHTGLTTFEDDITLAEIKL